MSRFIVLILSTILLGAPHIAHSKVSYTTSYGTKAAVIETPGNLEITHELPCIALKDAKKTYTAADLFKSYSNCLKNKEYVKAVEISVLAKVYAVFDSERVLDKSAGQSALALDERYTFDAMSLDQYIAEYIPVHSGIVKDKINLAKLCQQVKAIGFPDYYPSYMIQHGLGQILNEHMINPPSPLVENFNPSESWDSVLELVGCRSE